MGWKLSPNLQIRHDMILAVYPHMVIGEIGDQAHLAEHSDHNKDARDIVHAEDVMTETDTANAGAAAHILAWLLSDTTDLQYLIHDRIEYQRSNGFKPQPYTGSDPHTNHIHVSSKHGPTGEDAATGTGYDTAAEAYVPAVSLEQFLEATMNVTDADGAALIWRMEAVTNRRTAIAGGPEKGHPVPIVLALNALEEANVALKAELDGKATQILDAIAAIPSQPAGPTPVSGDLDVTGRLHLIAQPTVATGGTTPGQ